MRRALRPLVVVLAVLAAVVPLPAPWVERVYSGAIFPRVQALVTSLSNLVPFALFDLLIVVAIACSVVELNLLSDEAHRQVWTDRSRYDPAFEAAFTTAMGKVDRRARLVPGRPKSTLLDLYFRRASVAGMTDPYFLETLLASDLLFV